jgi:hypothetical protein
MALSQFSREYGERGGGNMKVRTMSVLATVAALGFFVSMARAAEIPMQ